MEYRQMPAEKGLDHSLDLLSEGYLFIRNRRWKYQSDLFQTRLMGQPVICMAGKEAAQLFYDENVFQRKGAAPKRVQKTLFGEKAIQTMDGSPHKHRKLLFMSLMTPEKLKQLSVYTKMQWEAAVRQWEKRSEIVLFEEAQIILCRTACQWAGVPIEEKDVKVRAKQFGALVDAFGAVGPRHWRGRKARKQTEEWIETVIQQVRSKKLKAPEGTAVYEMAWHRDEKGKLLDERMAAIELINILRPIVAIATFITFAATALHEFPEARRKVFQGDEAYKHYFIQEVRRFYPFGPFTGARVREDFQWNGYHFSKGTLALLDIYGTNRHPSLWKQPDLFKPERFENWDGSPFDFIPQGGGDYYQTHRCAGEWATIDIMKISLDYLTKAIVFDLPVQDLSFSLSKMPTLPESGFVMRNVKTIGQMNREK